MEKPKRTIIEECPQGYKIGAEIYDTLQDAVAETDGFYTFIPYHRK